MARLAVDRPGHEPEDKISEMNDANSIQGKVCLVTGANAGIGRATAAGLAELGATVIMVARNREQGQLARDEIRRQSGNPHVTLFVADLSSQQEVRQLTRTVEEQFPALHVLINNAAIIPPERQESVDGIEMQLAVNLLAPFLLTNLLLDLLKRSAPARIINVSSQTHSGARIPFDDLQSRQRYQSSNVYAWTKLALILFTYELARRLEGTAVTVNTLHPGVVNTNLLYDYMGMPRAMRRSNARGVSPEQGAETPLYLAAADAVANVTGQYFRDRRPVESSPASYDQAAARRLWQAAEALTNLG